ncbi:NUDIX domain-containing protein [Xanthobacter sp. KR7-65]|uniref:NUDIX hydrolase n=1 Tax=Xanthobacter sp. KR7-65 TaxID=3156612 RepID=UPI0032B39E06
MSAAAEPDPIARPAARLLVLDAEDRLLLFRFVYESGPLAGSIYWAPPGGGLEPGETFEDAACRELEEETGLRLAHPGPVIAERRVTFMMPDGCMVSSDERYFLVRAPGLVVSDAGWSAAERAALVGHRWWSRTALAVATEQVWPQDVAVMLVEAGIW